jgi:hypothetical protein
VTFKVIYPVVPYATVFLPVWKRSRLRNVQVFANLLRNEFDDLAMTRNRRRFLHTPINVDGVITTFAQEFTVVFLKVTQ